MNPTDLLPTIQHLQGLLQDAQPAAPARSPEGYQALLRAFLELLVFLANAAGGVVVGVAIVRGLHAPGPAASAPSAAARCPKRRFGYRWDARWCWR